MKREPAPAHDPAQANHLWPSAAEIGPGERSAPVDPSTWSVCSLAAAVRGADRLDRRSGRDEDEDRSEVGKTRAVSGSGSQRQPGGCCKGGGEPFDRQLRQIGQEGVTVTAQREPDAQRVPAEQHDDEQVPELTRAPVGWEAEQGQQERRGQDPGVGDRDRREVRGRAVQRWVRSAAGRQAGRRAADHCAEAGEHPHAGVRDRDRTRVHASASCTRRNTRGVGSVLRRPFAYDPSRRRVGDLRVGDVQRWRQTGVVALAGRLL